MWVKLPTEILSHGKNIECVFLKTHCDVIYTLQYNNATFQITTILFTHFTGSLSMLLLHYIFSEVILFKFDKH